MTAAPEAPDWAGVHKAAEESNLSGWLMSRIGEVAQALDRLSEGDPEDCPVELSWGDYGLEVWLNLGGEVKPRLLLIGILRGTDGAACWQLAPAALLDAETKASVFEKWKEIYDLYVP